MAGAKKRKERLYCDEPMARSKGYIGDPDDPNLFHATRIVRVAYAALRLLRMVAENMSK